MSQLMGMPTTYEELIEYMGVHLHAMADLLEQFEVPHDDIHNALHVYADVIKLCSAVYADLMAQGKVRPEQQFKDGGEIKHARSLRSTDAPT